MLRSSSAAGTASRIRLAVAVGPSRFTVEEVKRHLETNAWVIAQFAIAGIDLPRAAAGPAHVVVIAERKPSVS